MSKTVNIKVRDLVALYCFLFILLFAVLVVLNKQIQTDEQVRVLEGRLNTMSVLVNNIYGKNGDELRKFEVGGNDE